MRPTSPFLPPVLRVRSLLPWMTAVTCALVVAGCERPFGPVPDGITITVVAGGAPQTAMVGTAVPITPSIKVTTASGAPLAGADAIFSFTGPGNYLIVSRARTDASGVASPFNWVLGPTPGPQEMVAFVSSSTTDTRAVFTATATAPPP